VIPVNELPKTIILKGDFDLQEEARSAATITPGMLIDRNSANAVIPHATAGGPAALDIAIENPHLGKTINDNYVSGDLVFLHRLKKGEEFYGLLPAAAAAVTPATFMSSNGDGTFKTAGSTDIRLCKPVESVDNSAGGSAARCKMRVI
jgi:hypothetical protein